MHIHHGRLEPLSLNMLNKGAAPNRGSWGLFLANCWLIRFFQEMTIFFQRNICWPCLELASLLFFLAFYEGLYRTSIVGVAHSICHEFFTGWCVTPWITARPCRQSRDKARYPMARHATGAVKNGHASGSTAWNFPRKLVIENATNFCRRIL